MADHHSRPWNLKELAEYEPHVPLSVNTSTPQQASYDAMLNYGGGLPPKPLALGARALANRCRCDECRSLNESGIDASDVRIKYADYDNIDAQGSHQWSDHQYMLCSSRFYAFVLKDRKWGERPCPLLSCCSCLLSTLR